MQLGQWDQFQSNKEKYNVETTFNEYEYTSEVHPERFSREKRQLADSLYQVSWRTIPLRFYRNYCTKGKEEKGRMGTS